MALRKRCGKCEAYKYVEVSSRLFMPNPPFEYATSTTMKYWNRIVNENPCEEWETEPCKK